MEKVNGAADTPGVVISSSGCLWPGRFPSAVVYTCSPALHDRPYQPLVHPALNREEVDAV